MQNNELLEMINQLDKQDFELSSDIKLLYDEIKNIEGSFDTSKIEKEIGTLKENISSIQLQKGDKGDKGEKGDKGDKGKDGKNGKDGKDGRNGIDGINGLNGKDGTDGSPDTPEQIVEKINTLENVIERKTIKGLDTVIDKPELDRAIDILDRRTQYLINKTVVAPSATTWGSITGTLSNQTDLQNELNLKYDASNPAGYITSSALSGYLQNNVGISGGTTLIGGTASGNNLTLVSTSNATKGKILFGTSAYDEVNNRLGIGTTTPAYLLSIGSISKGFAEYNSGGGLDAIKVVANNAGAGFGVQNLAINGFSGVEYIGSDGALKVFTGYQNSTGEFRFNNIATNGYITFKIAGSDKLTIANTGNVGIGTTSPTAYLHLKAGTATANTAPLKFTTGTNTTVAVAGQMEYNNTFHLTNSDATRRHIVTAPNTTKVTASAPYTNDGYITINIGGTDFKVMTTA